MKPATVKELVVGHPEGHTGTTERLLSTPQGIAATLNGHILIADASNGRVQVILQQNREHVRTLGVGGSDSVHLCWPCEIDVTDVGDRILVSDYDQNKVHLFSWDGDHLEEIGSAGNGLGEFNGPYGVCMDNAGTIVVADQLNHRIQVRKEGCWHSFGSEGNNPGFFLYPSGVGLTPRGELVVCDSNNHRLQVMDVVTGRCLQVLGCEGSAPGEFVKPHSVAVAQDGSIVVADIGNRRVQVLVPNGGWTVLCTDLARPAGVAVDRDGNILVSEFMGNRVWVLRGWK